MPPGMLDDETIARAGRLQRQAIEAIFAEYYPVVHRMAYALCGRAETGRRVVVFVFKRALRVLPKWRDQEDAQRWFHHHTVLASRRGARDPPPLTDDVFIVNAE